ncbi:MAG: cyclic nucleotide-binding and patatin-like phospholipase domain-containing protein [Spirochaetota bacterium]
MEKESFQEMNIDVKDFSLLQGLEDKHLQLIRNSLQIKYLTAGELLFETDDPADSLYFLLAGKLEVSVPGKNNTSYIIPGESFGEVAILNDERRSASVIAKRDSVLYSLQKSTAKELMYQAPEFTIRLAQESTKNLLKERKNKAIEPLEIKTIAWLGLEKEDSFADIRSAFYQQIQKTETSVLLSQSPFWPLMQKAEKLELFTDLHQEAIVIFSQLEKTNTSVIIDIPNFDLSWQRFLLRQADFLFFVAKPTTPLHSIQVFEKLLKHREKFKLNYHVLIQKNDSNEELSQWLQTTHPIYTIQDDDPFKEATFLTLLCKKNLIDSTFKDLAVLNTFSKNEKAKIYSELKFLHLQGGQTVIKKNESGKELFFVIRGRLCAIAEGKSRRILKEFGAGDLFGEMSVLSNVPRSAKVVALRDSTIASLSTDSLDKLNQRIPDLRMKIAEIALKRLQGIDQKVRVHDSNTFCLISLQKQSHWQEFEQLLFHEMEKYGKVILITQKVVEQETGFRFAKLQSMTSTIHALRPWFEKIESQYKYIIFSCNEGSPEWKEYAIRQSDRMWWVGQADANHFANAEEKKWGERKRSANFSFHHLILLHPGNDSLPQGTAKWLDERPWLHFHHHIRNYREDDLHRAIRITLGNAYGLTFGGASSRGIAYLGMLQALEEKQYPIDILSGSSSGSGIASLVSLELSHEERLEKTVKINQGLNIRPWDITLPAVSLRSGKKIERILKAVYGNRNIEDLVIPIILSAVDLKTRQLSTIQRGPLWLAVRASGSLPLVWPPVVTEEQVFVDSGIMHNLPAEFLYPFCHEGWQFIADLNDGNSGSPFDNIEKYGATLSGWKTLFASKRKKYPQIYDVMIECMCIESFARQSKVETMKGHDKITFLTPSLQQYGIFDVKEKKIIHELVETSYKYTLKRLAGIPLPIE